MQNPPSIPHVARDAGPTSFAELRARGVALLQAVSGHAWTDHNLHDPGITLLEQLCFALTDVGYRIGFPVADHLSGEDGEIDFDGLSLHAPADAFPCRATTAADYRRVLLDAVPGLDDAVVQAGADGVLRLVLTLSQGAVESREARIAAARAAYFAQRNLGEDLDPQVVCTDDLYCGLHAQIDIGGPRESVDILAEVYDRCDRFIARAAESRNLDERLRAGETLEQIYTGPALRHGFVDDLPAGAGGAQRLYLSDLAAEVMQVPGVEQIRLAELRPAVGGSMDWRGEGWALRLALPGADAPPTIELLRRGTPAPVDTALLCRKLEDLRAAGRANRARQQTDQARRAAAALPRGQHRALGQYHSVQHLLPAIYGVGRHGVPPSAPPQARARALQLQGYLLMMEQVIAQGLAQLQQLRSLFAVHHGSPQTLWSQVIDEDSLPGVGQLLIDPAQGGPAEQDGPGGTSGRGGPGAQRLEAARAERLQQAVYAPFDEAAVRKCRVLDHLLALHGETYTQNSMRQFGGHHTRLELEALLLANKAHYLAQVVELARNRASGFDPGRRPHDHASERAEAPGAPGAPFVGPLEPVNCSGLQRRTALLLGFRLRAPRSLTQGLAQRRLTLVAEPEARHLPLQVPAAQAQGGTVAGPAGQAPSDAQMLLDVGAMQVVRGRLPQALVHAGVWRERYRLLAQAGRPDAQRLVLGPDAAGHWWHLGLYDSTEAARRAAASLRRFLLELQYESEGMHVVEHILLRPLVPGAAAHAPDGFHALCVTVVLPDWTLRTAQPAFQALAAQTLRINCPSHLSLRCRWLGVAAMARFEAAWEPWLAARRALAEAPEDGQRAAQADAAARCVIAQLLQHDAPAADEGEAPFLQGHA